MGYTLEAVIGAAGLLRARTDAPVVPLVGDLALLPVTDQFFDAVTDGNDERALGLYRLPGGFDRVLADWSAAGPVGYVEAEYFGGVGDQRAALWTGGALVFGPVSADVGPISQLLERLGVERGEHGDAFDAAGLGRHRHTEDWLVTPGR